MIDISTRFSKFLEHIGSTAYKFSKEIGTSEAVISNIKSGKSKPSADLLEKILNKYEALNINWLLSGKGEMLAVDKLQAAIKKADKNFPEKVLKIITNSDRPTDRPTDRPKLSGAVIYEGRSNIILVDQRVAAGWAQIVHDEAQMQDLPRFTMPQLMYSMGIFYCFPVTGDSMHPTVKDKEWVVVKEKSGILDIKGGRVYMICTPEGLCLKRLYYKTGEKTVKCVSDNETHAPYRENIADILGIYEAVMHMSDDFQNANHELRTAFIAALDRISKLEAHVYDKK